MANKSEGYVGMMNSKALAAQKGNGEIFQGIKHKYDAAAAPTVNDDITEGFGAGSEWIINNAGDATDGDVYKCTDGSEGAANWELIHDATP